MSPRFVVELNAGRWWVVDRTPGPFSRWVNHRPTEAEAQDLADRLNTAATTPTPAER